MPGANTSLENDQSSDKQRADKLQERLQRQIVSNGDLENFQASRSQAKDNLHLQHDSSGQSFAFYSPKVFNQDSLAAAHVELSTPAAFGRDVRTANTQRQMRNRSGDGGSQPGSIDGQRRGRSSDGRSGSNNGQGRGGSGDGGLVVSNGRSGDGSLVVDNGSSTFAGRSLTDPTPEHVLNMLSQVAQQSQANWQNLDILSPVQLSTAQFENQLTSAVAASATLDLPNRHALALAATDLAAAQHRRAEGINEDQSSPSNDAVHGAMKGSTVTPHHIHPHINTHADIHTHSANAEQTPPTSPDATQSALTTAIDVDSDRDNVLQQNDFSTWANNAQTPVSLFAPSVSASAPATDVAGAPHTAGQALSLSLNACAAIPGTAVSGMPPGNAAANAGVSNSEIAAINSMVIFNAGTDPTLNSQILQTIDQLPASTLNAIYQDHPGIEILPGGAQTGNAGSFDPNANQVVIYEGTGIEQEATAHEMFHVQDLVAGFTGATTGQTTQLDQLAQQDLNNMTPQQLSQLQSLAPMLVDPPYISDSQGNQYGIGDIAAEITAGYINGDNQTGVGPKLAQLFPDVTNYLEQQINPGAPAVPGTPAVPGVGAGCGQIGSGSAHGAPLDPFETALQNSNNPGDQALSRLLQDLKNSNMSAAGFNDFESHLQQDLAANGELTESVLVNMAASQMSADGFSSDLPTLQQIIQQDINPVVGQLPGGGCGSPGGGGSSGAGDSGSFCGGGGSSGGGGASGSWGGDGSAGSGGCGSAGSGGCGLAGSGGCGSAGSGKAPLDAFETALQNSNDPGDQALSGLLQDLQNSNMSAAGFNDFESHLQQDLAANGGLTESALVNMAASQMSQDGFSSDLPTLQQIIRQDINPVVGQLSGGCGAQLQNQALGAVAPGQRLTNPPGHDTPPQLAPPPQAAPASQVPPAQQAAPIKGTS